MTDKQKPKNGRNFLITFFITLLLVMFLITFVFGINRMYISGNSMLPNLHNKEHAITFNPCWKKDQEYKRGDVIAFRADQVDPHVKIQYPGKKNIDYVKRIIGIPGDKIEFKNHTLYINDKKVNQDFIPKESATKMTEIQNYPENFENWNLTFLSETMKFWNEYSRKNTIKGRIPKDCYFVLGDNRKVSWDSRYFGYVPKSQIIGKLYEFEGNKKERQIVNNYQLKLEK